MSRTVTNTSKLSILQTLIEKEFAEFKDEIITGTGADVFNRAEEILFKAHLADEVLGGFQALEEFLADEEDLNNIVNTLYEIMKSTRWDNLLDGVYEEYLLACESFFDTDLLSDFLIETYKDEL